VIEEASEAGAKSNSPEAPHSPPRGAYESLLTLALVTFVGVAACIFAFGYWGENVVDGLENAAAEAMFLAAQKLQDEGHASLAIERFRIALEGRFRNEETFFQCGRALGDLLRQEGRYDEAAEVYRRLPEAAFATAGAYTGFTDVLYQQGQHEEAARLAQVWLELAEHEGAAQQIEWANALLCRLAQQRGEPTTALEHARAAVAANPKSDMGLPLAQLLHATGERNEARKQLERFIAITENPKLRLDALALQQAWGS
jgi:tetratricopeptide (TPR) repeat protein